MSDFNDELKDLGDGYGTEAGQWEYPTVGYNSTDGVFYIGDAQAASLQMVILAIRRCKEVDLPDGSIVRYDPFFKKAGMQPGKARQRLQALVVVNGEIHLFGAKSWAARALFDNTAEGPYADKNHPAGLVEALKGWIKAVKAKQNVATSMYCWEVAVTTGKAFKNPQDKSRMITPLAYDPAFSFVGRARAAEYKAMLASEDTKGWMAEWHKPGAVTETPEPEPEVVEDFGDLGGFPL